MPDDLRELPETSGDGTDQGQGSDGGQAAETPPVSPPQKYDLHKDPTFQQVQSERDSAEARANREAAARRALEQELQAYKDVAESNLDPEALEAARNLAAARAVANERDFYKEQYETTVFRTYWAQQAAEAGVDPQMTQQAIEESLRVGGHEGTSIIRSLVMAQRIINARPPQTPPAPVEEPQETPEMPPKDTAKSRGYTPPPQGIAPAKPLSEAEKEALYGDLNDLLRNPTKNKDKIAELRKRIGS